MTESQGSTLAKPRTCPANRDHFWLLAVYNGDDTLKSRFLYAAGRMPMGMVQDGKTYYFAYDQVGSLRAVTDSEGSVVKTVRYDSFGNIFEDTNPALVVPFGFAGGLHDRDTGLVRFGYRDYDLDTGRWTAKDPIGFDGGSVNLYGYALASPTQRIDIDGFASIIEVAADALVHALGMSLEDILETFVGQPCAKTITCIVETTAASATAGAIAGAGVGVFVAGVGAIPGAASGGVIVGGLGMAYSGIYCPFKHILFDPFLKDWSDEQYRKDKNRERDWLFYPDRSGKKPDISRH